MNGHEKRWDFRLRRIDCKPVLHRPLETTSVSGPSRFRDFFFSTHLHTPVKTRMPDTLRVNLAGPLYLATNLLSITYTDHSRRLPHCNRIVSDLNPLVSHRCAGNNIVD